MSNRPYKQFGPFRGLNTVDDSKDLSPKGEDVLCEFTQGENVDIDNNGVVELRKGKTLRASGNIHSIWPPMPIPIQICLFVEGTELKMLNTDYTKTTLKTGLTAGLRMSYAHINNQVWYSNGEVLGYVEDYADHTLSTPTESFKSVMYPGDIIAFYNNRLYAAKGNAIYFSDPMAFGWRDRRFCRLYFPGRIVLLKPVSDGIFISYGGWTYFMGGSDPDSFVVRDVAEYGAIDGAIVDIERDLMGANGITGNAVMWMSERGICVGTDGGGFKNLTIKRYAMPTDLSQGTAIYKKKNNGIGHFISVVHN